MGPLIFTIFLSLASASPGASDEAAKNAATEILRNRDASVESRIQAVEILRFHMADPIVAKLMIQLVHPNQNKVINWIITDPDVYQRSEEIAESKTLVEHLFKLLRLNRYPGRNKKMSDGSVERTRSFAAWLLGSIDFKTKEMKQRAEKELKDFLEVSMDSSAGANVLLSLSNLPEADSTFIPRLLRCLETSKNLEVQEMVLYILGGNKSAKLRRSVRIAIARTLMNYQRNASTIDPKTLATLNAMALSALDIDEKIFLRKGGTEIDEEGIYKVIEKVLDRSILPHEAREISFIRHQFSPSYRGERVSYEEALRRLRNVDLEDYNSTTGIAELQALFETGLLNIRPEAHKTCKTMANDIGLTYLWERIRP